MEHLKMKAALFLLFFVCCIWGQWEQLPNPISPIYNSECSITDFKYYKNNIFASATYGTFYSTDEGESWKVISRESLSFIIDNDKLFSYSNKNLLILSSDSTLKWDTLQTFENVTNVSTIRTITNQLLVSSTYNDGISISKDYGKTWNKADSGLQSYTMYTFNSNSTTIFAGAEDGMYFTKNAGENWELVSTAKYRQAVYFTGSTIYSGQVRNIALIGDYIFASCNFFQPNAGFGYSNDKLLKTTLLEKAWVETPYTDKGAIRTLKNYNQYLFIGSSDFKVFVFNVLNDSLAEVSANLPTDLGIYALEICGKYLMCGGVLSRNSSLYSFTARR
jgi:photosystem II stability/assembly factor-like uncharacterized protein